MIDRPGRFATEINQSVPVAGDGEFEPLRLGAGQVSEAGVLPVWPPVVLAPMAGVTNLAFRSLCREYGAGLYVSEMITARGYLMGNRLTNLLASSSPDEKPRSVQVYGADPVDLGEMVKSLVDDGVHHLDINMGCPVPKVTRAGGGSAIPVKPRLLARLVRAMVQNAGDVPVTIKMRMGISDSLLTYEEAGRAAAGEGASAVGLHARTASQLYSGEADWSAIGRLVEILDVPVLGNGDIWEPYDALRMMRQTGCHGVIVGRGCLGRPWLFRELSQVFNGEEPDLPPNFGQIVEIMVDHANRLIDVFGPVVGMRQMRKWTAWYTKGFHGSAAVRGNLMRIHTVADLVEAVRPLDPEEPFPVAALRAQRAKGSKTQSVKLPEGYLDDLDDDTPPKSPRSVEEIEAWEKALNGG
ncbi:tRNA-dihydrouridine synthase C [Planctomycetes bacterium Poly30]|uniref:tRNA-dihydrouridine synthase C n=1 Tax=Saltatorellus ferox TaxID=2528018 RepID=A0A518ET55_9BACT|nr:tRNA-dihydrouridine synthase C [Planctomycetes bacterium Poly30]